MNSVTILFFATLKELAGTGSLSLELPPGARVKDLKTILKEQFPALAPALTSTLTSINRNFAFDDDVIPPGAEVAFFPPVSGG